MKFNANTITAFVLILCTLVFFNSKTYYHKILKKPHPSELFQSNKKAVPTPVPLNKPDTEILKPVTPIDSIEKISEVIDTGLITSDTIWVETDKMRVGINERGGKIISLKMKDYFYDNSKGHNEIELIADGLQGGANCAINDRSFDNADFNRVDSTTNYVVTGNDSIIIRLKNSDSELGFVEKRFVIKGNRYTIGVTVSSPMLSEKRVTIGWNGGIAESEDFAVKMGPSIARTIHLFWDNNVEHINEKKSLIREESGDYKWVGLTSKYFLVALIPQSVKNADIKIESYVEQSIGDGNKKNQIINYKYSIKRPVESLTDTYTIYAGPSILSELKQENADLQKVLYRGYRWILFADHWFPPLCVFVLEMLIWFQKGVKDYGIVIIFLTIILRVVTYPLTYSSMKSMSRMKDLQPKITAMRDKYKNNPKKQNEQLMALYKKEGVNPFNPGCMPIFIQMPIFISLYIVLNKAIELRGATTLLLPWVHDLSKPEALFNLSFTIPFYGNNFALLPIVMAILTYFQNKATIKDPNQQMMIYMMPIMMLVLFNSFPAGLVLYWTFSSALQLLQQFIMDRKKKTLPAAV
jgi:YidC/Oxa1 family membrane protein insertase